MLAFAEGDFVLGSHAESLMRSSNENIFPFLRDVLAYPDLPWFPQSSLPYELVAGKKEQDNVQIPVLSESGRKELFSIVELVTIVCEELREFALDRLGEKMKRQLSVIFIVPTGINPKLASALKASGENAGFRSSFLVDEALCVLNKLGIRGALNDAAMLTSTIELLLVINIGAACTRFALVWSQHGQVGVMDVWVDSQISGNAVQNAALRVAWQEFTRNTRMKDKAGNDPAACLPRRAAWRLNQALHECLPQLLSADGSAWCRCESLYEDRDMNVRLLKARVQAALSETDNLLAQQVGGASARAGGPLRVVASGVSVPFFGSLQRCERLSSVLDPMQGAFNEVLRGGEAPVSHAGLSASLFLQVGELESSSSWLLLPRGYNHAHVSLEIPCHSDIFKGGNSISASVVEWLNQRADPVCRFTLSVDQPIPLGVAGALTLNGHLHLGKPDARLELTLSATFQEQTTAPVTLVLPLAR